MKYPQEMYGIILDGRDLLNLNDLIELLTNYRDENNCGHKYIATTEVRYNETLYRNVRIYMYNNKIIIE